ncbi:hypothetical protein NDU88_001940 [Pleurodeles waltl]|uniref:Uncharacterized protein n=1 Tax=Pleurodeles waltl TaxID=8319 RepID=A0AAV7LB69_PLEWA|nr:hypothetical protein NDU88_001940 [Pleurodeles waltl]
MHMARRLDMHKWKYTAINVARKNRDALRRQIHECWDSGRNGGNQTGYLEKQTRQLQPRHGWKGPRMSHIGNQHTLIQGGNVQAPTNYSGALQLLEFVGSCKGELHVVGKQQAAWRKQTHRRPEAR